MLPIDYWEIQPQLLLMVYSSLPIHSFFFFNWRKFALKCCDSFCYQIRSDQSLSRVQLFATPWIAACQASLSITNSRSSLRLMSIESVMPSSHLILCRPLLLLPLVPPSIRVFSNESILRMRWPKYWSFSFSIIPCKEIPGLISFRMDWLDLLAVQGTLNSLLQHHSSKASSLRRSAFFTVQLSHPYMTTGKTIYTTMQIGHNYTYITSLLGLPPLTPAHSSRLPQSAWLGSLCYTATSHQLSILHMMVYICLCYFLHLFHSLLPPLCSQVHSLGLALVWTVRRSHGHYWWPRPLLP